LLPCGNAVGLLISSHIVDGRHNTNSPFRLYTDHIARIHIGRDLGGVSELQPEEGEEKLAQSEIAIQVPKS
jgi:hypothetical protein